MRILRVVTVLIFICACGLGWWTNKEVAKRDFVVPVIKAETDEIHLSVKDKDKMLLQGLTATDDRDGDITDRVYIERISRFSELGVCQVNYVVFDDSNNFGSYERTVYYDDYTSPRFSMSQPLMFSPGDEITLMDRIHLKDCLDGDISQKIKIESSSVSPSESGTYDIEISAVNNYGDEVRARVPLNVVEFNQNSPEIVLKNYLVYVKKGEEFNPKDYIKRIEDTDGSTMSKGEVSCATQVNVSKKGYGQVKYQITNEHGNTGITYLAVVVEE